MRFMTEGEKRGGQSSGGLPFAERATRWGLVVLFFCLVLLRGWQGDDAYITWRVVDNFLDGDGLTFNQGQRVQVFTSPLWLTVGIVCQFTFGELYFSVIGASALISAAALWLLLRESREPTIQLILAGSVLGSATAVDFGTSGLETPALAALTVAFSFAVLRRAHRRMALLSSLLFLCRPDALVLTAIPILVLGWQREDRSAWIKATAVGLSPIVCWVLFSTFYFGLPVANTALAKLNTEIPRLELMAQGVRYLVDYSIHEPWPALVIVSGCVAGLVSSNRPSKALAGSVMVHLIYVCWIGGDFMRGRFLVAPFWLALVLLAPAAKELFPAAQRLLALGAVGSVFWPTGPALNWDSSDYFPMERTPRIVDERAYYAPTTGLLNVLGASESVRNDAPIPPYPQGMACRNAARRGRPHIITIEAGYCGYFAGSSLQVFDYPGLTSPFLARVPFVPDGGWRPGHFHRTNLPQYVKRHMGDDPFADDGLEAAYQDIVLVSRGALWSWSRLGAIVRLCAGTHANAFQRLKAPDSVTKSSGG